MFDEIAGYAEGVKKGGTEHQLGSPPQHVFLGLLDGLIDSGGKIGGNQQLVKDIKDKVVIPSWGRASRSTPLLWPGPAIDEHSAHRTWR